MRTKSEVRALFLQKRKDLGETERQRRSERIAEEAMRFLAENSALKHIHLFLPIERLYEVNTWVLLEKLFAAEKQVYSSVSDFDMHEMHTVLIHKDSVFTTGIYGLPTPINPVRIADDQQMDVIFVPLLAFDLRGVRVGYGKGFYDRFFATSSKDVMKIGLSYFEETELLPRESHDVLLDGCIFPNGSIYFKEKG
nr:5-formyltetrahydrofolate cyclo-ligase [Cytophagales bacterium]